MNTLKPTPPFSPILRRILKKILGHNYYTTLIGRHERTTLEIWGIISGSLDSDSAIVDIGAYVGEFCIKSRLSNSLVTIHAIEPNTNTIKKLKKNILDLNIITSNLAISDSCEKRILSNQNEVSQIIENEMADIDSIEIESITLDKYQKKHDLKIKLVKIDTEGHEFKILCKSSSVLKKYSPIICCEVLNNEKGQKLAELLSNDYAFYHIDEKYKRITKKSKISRKLWRNRNWFLIPFSKKDNFEKLVSNSRMLLSVL